MKLNRMSEIKYDQHTSDNIVPGDCVINRSVVLIMDNDINIVNYIIVGNHYFIRSFLPQKL